MPIRNPFRRIGGNVGIDPSQANGGRPGSRDGPHREPEELSSLERKPLSLVINKSGRGEPDEYKMTGMVASLAPPTAVQSTLLVLWKSIIDQPANFDPHSLQ